MPESSRAMEILTRVVLGLFAAALFGGFPALMFAVLTWKVVRSRREGVWVAPKTGRRWTLKEHPERYRFYITFHTILAVVLGLITSGVMIVSFVACVLAPIKKTSVEMPTDPVPATVGKSKIATATREEFLKRLHAAFSEGGRKPVELDGVPLGGIVNAATIEQQFGKPDRVFVDEHPDGKPTWHWYLKDGEVTIDVVEEFDQSGEKLLKIGAVSHAGF